MGVISAYAGRSQAYIPVSAQAMAEHERIQLRDTERYRFSIDSGQGTEPNSESLRSHSISSTGSDELPDARHGNEDEEEKGLMHGSKVDKFLKHKIPGLLSSRLLKILQFFYNAVDRVILILGFIAMMTGLITYGGLFVSSFSLSPCTQLIV